MKIKKEYMVLAIVIVALIAYLVSRNRDRSLYDLPQIEAVQAKEITRIALRTPNGSIEFVKAGSDWKILPENYPADTQRVKAMLSMVENLTLTELISESKNYQRYDLDSTDGIVLKCWANDELKRDITIGKSADSFNHTFVKLPGNDAVYQAQGNFRDKLDMHKGEFRDKSVLSFDKQAVSEFEIRMNEATETFKKVEQHKEPSGSEQETEGGGDGPATAPQWMDAKGGEAETNQITRFLSTLADLHCEAYLEGKTKADYSDPVYHLRLKGGQEYSLSIYAQVEKEDEPFFPAVSSENDYPFLLTKWRAEEIMKKPGELIKKTGDDQ